MRELPFALYRAAQVRELDRIAIEDRGIPGYTLMSRAGEAAFHLLRQRWPNAQSITSSAAAATMAAMATWKRWGRPACGTRSTRSKR